MTREEVIKNLRIIAMSSRVNPEVLQEWETLINGISDEELPKKLEEYNIRDYRGLLRFTLGERVDLNDFCFCVLRSKSVDLHFTPKDISSEIMTSSGRKMLETGFNDAMVRLYDLLSRKENLDIQEITAVSHLIKPFVAKWFETYGFDTIVERTERIKNNKDSKLYPYYDKYKSFGGKEKGSIGMAVADVEIFKKIMTKYIEESQVDIGKSK